MTEANSPSASSSDWALQMGQRALAPFEDAVAAVLLLTGVGQGARAYVQTQVQGLGHGVIAVLPGRVETTGGMPGIGGVPNDLTLGDVSESALLGFLGASILWAVGLLSDQIAKVGMRAGAQ